MKLNPDYLQGRGRIGLLYGNQTTREQALQLDPGLHNVLGYERAFAADPAGMDFLDPTSSYHNLKALGAAVYCDIFDRHLAGVSPAAHALDLGCGIGRFTLPLSARLGHITAIEACRSALARCAAHLESAGRDNVELIWADCSWLADLPSAAFDILFAVELICYTAAPDEVLRQLARVARPGALLFLSVEAAPGALCGAPLPGPGFAARAMAGEAWIEPLDRYVRYYTRDALRALVTAAGWEVVEEFGTHFFGEGPLWQSIDDDRLSDPSYLAQVRDAERAARADPRLAPLARAIGIIGGKA